ncbi:MAG: ammonium transporter [Helicobacteraceae bacterium]|jgi:Amt family ammonium transporter|nr:ammonium transporter [Helicobacteraceae bacterium]
MEAETAASLGDSGYLLSVFLLIFGGALVFWMAAGFAMLESGLVRAKNVTVILTKNIGIMALGSVIYFLIGYDIMYGHGEFGVLFSFGSVAGEEGSDYGLHADFFFQVMFAATAASIVSGTVAERIKLIPFFIFTAILVAFVYAVVGNWTWGGTFLGAGGETDAAGAYIVGSSWMVDTLGSAFSDFAGSTIVHSVGGWAALAGALLLGARSGKYGADGKVRPIPGSNLPLATLGTFCLWLGWFGFNGASELALVTKDNANNIALVCASTHLGASAGAVAAAILSKIIYKKIDLTFVLNGTLAGLVAVTAGPNIALWVGALEGAVGGVLVVLAVPLFDKLKIDDPVGALSVHLVAGIWGTLAVGLFNPEVTLLAQLFGVVVIGAFTFIASSIVWYILKLTLGIRVSQKEEHDGTDLSETGLEAYPEFAKNAK